MRSPAPGPSEIKPFLRLLEAYARKHLALKRTPSFTAGSGETGDAGLGLPEGLAQQPAQGLLGHVRVVS